jgi:HPr Serine kinase C-terminal domain
MAFYSLDNLTLEVRHQSNEIERYLTRLLNELSFARIPSLTSHASLCLSVRRKDDGFRLPTRAREVFRANGIRGWEVGNDFYLTDGSSLLHLEPSRGHGDAQLDSEFFTKPLILQVDFLAFGLVKLARHLGLFGLHAAGVVTQDGLGLLIIGESGAGKSTLAIGLIQRGWRYLSDEVVLLRLRAEGVEALPLCKGFYVDTDGLPGSGELTLGEEIVDSSGRRKRRVCIESTYLEQYVPRCTPHVLLFSRIVPEAHSSLFPLDRLSALKYLLLQSGVQWFDRATMAQHLEVLKKLTQQAAIYQLSAGRDLHHNPSTLARLLAEAEERGDVPDCSRADQSV